MERKQRSPYSVRLEPEVEQWVKEQAKAGDRSVNAQINRLIREAKEGTAGKAAYAAGRLDALSRTLPATPADWEGPGTESTG